MAVILFVKTVNSLNKSQKGIFANSSGDIFILLLLFPCQAIVALLGCDKLSANSPLYDNSNVSVSSKPFLWLYRSCYETDISIVVCDLSSINVRVSTGVKP